MMRILSAALASATVKAPASKVLAKSTRRMTDVVDIVPSPLSVYLYYLAFPSESMPSYSDTNDVRLSNL